MKNTLLALAVIATTSIFTGCHHHSHHRVITPVQSRYIEAGPKHDPQRIHKLPQPGPKPRPMTPPPRY